MNYICNFPYLTKQYIEDFFQYLKYQKWNVLTVVIIIISSLRESRNSGSANYETKMYLLSDFSKYFIRKHYYLELLLKLIRNETQMVIETKLLEMYYKRKMPYDLLHDLVQLT